MTSKVAENTTSDVDSILEDVMRKSQIKKMNEVGNEDIHVLDTDGLHLPIKNHAFNLYESIGNTDPAAQMEGLELIEPMQLYNILMQHSGGYPSVSDPNYLLLLGNVSVNPSNQY